MNGQPHTHKIELRRKFYNLEHRGPWVIKYGDTEVPVRPLGHIWVNHEDPFPTEKQIRKATIRAIQKHDDGSVRAATRDRTEEESAKTAVADLNEALKFVPGDEWPSLNV